jgi:ankyrin repeat protein
MWPQQLVVWNCYPEAAAAAAVTALLEAGADVDGLAAGGLTALQIAARESEDANVMRAVIPLLLGAGADVNKQVVWGGTPLHCAVLNEDPDAAQVAISLLVAGGADINAGDKDGKLSRHFAAECSNSAIVIVLLASRANVMHNARSARHSCVMLHGTPAATTAAIASVHWWQLESTVQQQI